MLQSIAPKRACTAATLRTGVRQAQGGTAHRPGSTTSDRKRLPALEREVRRLKGANEILRKAAAYFAQAELDRRSKWRRWCRSSMRIAAQYGIESICTLLQIAEPTYHRTLAGDRFEPSLRAGAAR